MIYLYGIVCIGLELTVWLVPNLVENAFAISLVGFFMGPMYPTIVMILSKMVPPRFVRLLCFAFGATLIRLCYAHNRLFGGAIGWISW